MIKFLTGFSFLLVFIEILLLIDFLVETFPNLIYWGNNISIFLSCAVPIVLISIFIGEIIDFFFYQPEEY